jgi:hypothetical protein
MVMNEETKQNTTDDVKKLLKELKRLGMETLFLTFVVMAAACFPKQFD